jgi:transglutaminase-like putative cysteine protease
VATTDSPAGARNTDYAQALALAGLLAGASLSLSRLYAGNAWLLPTWLTMAAALGLAALLRRLGVGQLLSLAAMVVGFVVVAGILLFPGTLLVVLPTRETLAEMARAASSAMTAVSEQAAPVEVTTEFVLLTCAGAWAVATAADGLAFRARQPLLALVPALGLFVFPAVIRPTSPAWYTAWFLLGAAGLLLFEGRARLATWGRWVSHARSRPGAGWRLPLTPAAQTGRWLALAAGLCALTLPWLLPGYGQPGSLDVKQHTGSDTGVALNPFVSLRTRLTAQENVPMFRARTTQRERWRLMVYDRFDGTKFAPSSDPRANLVDFAGPAPGELDPDLRVTQVTQEVEIQELGSFWLPAATVPVRVDAGRPVLANQSFASLTINQRLRRGFSYTVVSQVPQIEAADLAGPVDYQDYPELQPYIETGSLDAEVRERARAVVDAKDADTPFEEALAIQDYLRSDEFRYSLNVPALSAGGNQLRRFLTEVREGYCEQFAIAMAVMAREVGIPSRVAVGFTQGEIVDQTWTQVATHDAHAWPELWFPKAGWVPFEPTPRADGTVTLPIYTTPAGRVPGGQDGVTTQPTTPGGTATTNPRTQAPEPLPAGESDPLAGGGADRGLLERPVVRAGLALALLVGLVPAVKWGRNLLARRRAARRPRDAVAESYAELTSWARDAGLGRRGAETPAAYARRLRGDFDADADPLVELTGLFEWAEYARAEPGPDQADQARQLARSARSSLAGRLGWRRRLVAAVSPRSLLAARLAAPRELPRKAARERELVGQPRR